MKSLFLKCESETSKLGATLAHAISPPGVIFLEGQLGAGKTTLFRGFLKALSFRGSVKSPTFTLLETYAFPDRLIVHMDLYRLQDPIELYTVGFEDYLSNETILVIEWAEKAENQLPKPSLLCNIKIPANGVGRMIDITLFSSASRSLRIWFEGME